MVWIEFIFVHSSHEINIQDTKFLLDEYEKLDKLWAKLLEITKKEMRTKHKIMIPKTKWSFTHVSQSKFEMYETKHKTKSWKYFTYTYTPTQQGIFQGYTEHDASIFYLITRTQRQYMISHLIRVEYDNCSGNVCT